MDPSEAPPVEEAPSPAPAAAPAPAPAAPRPAATDAVPRVLPTRVQSIGGVDVLQVTGPDVGFLLGRSGKTKEKIARVSGATLEIRESDGTVEIRGTPAERQRARKYINCVLEQRVGPVTVDEADSEDLTLIKVPSSCVGFVTGQKGNFLRMLEEEWGTLMFFLDYDLRLADERDFERLAIFGPLRGRRGAELKVMSVIEVKEPAKLTQDCVEGNFDDPVHPDWGTALRYMDTPKLSWILGKQGQTRKKIAAASEAIVEYVGNWVHIAGTKLQRERALEYLEWTLQQLEDPVCRIPHVGRREDVTLVSVPRDCIAYVMGQKRQTLTAIEEEWGAMMLFLDDKERRDPRPGKDTETLAIFGPRRNRRGCELKVMSAVETKCPGYFTRDVHDCKSTDAWGTDTFHLRDDELSYVLGKEGKTRQKLARASHCILQIVGPIAYFAGEYEERRRARRYMKWLLEQQGHADHKIKVKNPGKEQDVELMQLRPEAVPLLMGHKSEVLRKIEEETETFLFIGRDDTDTQRLFVCGHSSSGRAKAQRALDREIKENIGPDLANRPAWGYDPVADFQRLGAVPANRPAPGERRLYDPDADRYESAGSHHGGGGRKGGGKGGGRPFAERQPRGPPRAPPGVGSTESYDPDYDRSAPVPTRRGGGGYRGPPSGPPPRGPPDMIHSQGPPPHRYGDYGEYDRSHPPRGPPGPPHGRYEWDDERGAPPRRGPPPQQRGYDHRSNGYPPQYDDYGPPRDQGRMGGHRRGQMAHHQDEEDDYDDYAPMRRGRAEKYGRDG
eukprot:TRINITY_DN5958_c3_g1_i1.p1 TRINITY_DN5958_c3_g1~~TRINITY_DN5958_c3_g1_i1.p1  ORF type:complete len:806 (+),score=311.34 TRINITY_DN5958_c3_g1_i1:67-2418(+)